MSDIHQDRLQRLKAMLLDQPNEPFLLFALAKEQDALGEPKQAIETYRNLLTHDAEYLGAYYHLAELLDRYEMEKDAIEVADVGIKLAEKQGNQKDLAELIQLRASF